MTPSTIRRKASLNGNPERTFSTSDTHLGHTAILRYDRRPWDSVEEHDEALLDGIRSTLKPGDVLYHLGDVAFRLSHVKRFLEAVRDYRVILIRGNHDDDGAWKLRDQFHAAYEAHYLRIAGETVYLSHYAHRVWRNSAHGSYHLFGHSHGDLFGFGRSMDVGVNCNGYKPVSMAEVIEKLEHRTIINHHSEETAHGTSLQEVGHALTPITENPSPETE